jgi:hypothetical protein
MGPIMGPYMGPYWTQNGLKMSPSMGPGPIFGLRKWSVILGRQRRNPSHGRKSSAHLGLAWCPNVHNYMFFIPTTLQRWVLVFIDTFRPSTPPLPPSCLRISNQSSSLNTGFINHQLQSSSSIISLNQSSSAFISFNQSSSSITSFSHLAFLTDFLSCWLSKRICF